MNERELGLSSDKLQIQRRGENPLKRYTVYMLRCREGALYTGYTGNLKRRLREHDSGHASRFTRTRLPVRLVYAEKLNSIKAAMRRERQIKSMTRGEKLALISVKSRGGLKGATK